MTKEAKERDEWRGERIYSDGDIHRNPGPGMENITQNRKDTETVWSWLKGSATKIAESFHSFSKFCHTGLWFNHL